VEAVKISPFSARRCALDGAVSLYSSRILLILVPYYLPPFPFLNLTISPKNVFLLYFLSYLFDYDNKFLYLNHNLYLAN